MANFGKSAPREENNNNKIQQQNMAEKESSDVENVCDFLLKRNVSHNVIQKFRNNKMDKNAVREASKEDLQQLGLTEKGHILCLKSFVLSSTGSLLDDKKRLLANSIKSSASERTKKMKVANRLQTKLVQIGWKHSSIADDYKQVRAQGGGGVRELTLNNSDTLGMLKEEALKLFFPRGKSTKFANLDNLDVKLGDFSGDIIKDLGVQIESYVKSIKMSGRTRLYILTRQKTFRDMLWSCEESEDDEEDFQSYFTHKPTTNNKLDEFEKGSTDSSSLIGTTQDRDVLKASIDKAYKESLVEDKQKDQLKQENELKEKELRELMNARNRRVPSEPDLSQPHVTISVRHCHLGTKVRIFKVPCLYHQVYDWVGSLDLRPEHFEIRDYSGRIVRPDEETQSGTFNMIEVENPILMSPSGTISFKGFGCGTGSSITDSDSDVESNTIQEPKPLNLTLNHYEDLESIRIEESKKIVNELCLTVDRDYLYDGMLKLYQKRNTVTSRLNLSFNNENALGDGITRDAYSGFFEDLYKKMDGSFEKVPSTSLDEEELEIIGKIITHAYLTYGLFPVQISICSLQYHLFNSVSEEEVFASFMNFLPPRESEMINNLKNNVNCDTRPIMDILSDYSIFSLPTKENIDKLIIRAGKSALIKNPCFSMQSLKKGMGNFWEKISKSQFKTIFSCTIPNPENIIENLYTTEVTKQESKIVTWIHRYIRASSQQELIRLIRFITGSSMIAPNDKIKLQFVDQSPLHLRPLSQTCFRIFILARQYLSFTQLSHNLNAIIGNPESWSVHDI